MSEIEIKHLKSYSELINSLPESWLQKRTVTMNYIQMTEEEFSEWKQAFFFSSSAIN